MEAGLSTSDTTCHHHFYLDLDISIFKQEIEPEIFIIGNSCTPRVVRKLVANCDLIDTKLLSFNPVPINQTRAEKNLCLRALGTKKCLQCLNPLGSHVSPHPYLDSIMIVMRQHGHRHHKYNRSTRYLQDCILSYNCSGANSAGKSSIS